MYVALDSPTAELPGVLGKGAKDGFILGGIPVYFFF